MRCTTRCQLLLNRLKLRIKIRPFTMASLTYFKTICMDHDESILDGEMILYILLIIDYF